MNKQILALFLVALAAVVYGSIISPAALEEKVVEDGDQIATQYTNQAKCLEDMNQFNKAIIKLQRTAERRMIFESNDNLKKTKATFALVKESCANGVIETI